MESDAIHACATHPTNVGISNKMENVTKIKRDGRSCCVPHCTVSGSGYENGRLVTFHRFPVDDLRKRNWLAKVKRAVGPKFRVTKSTLVCSRHFKDIDYRYTGGYSGRCYLNNDAVPSVFECWKKDMTSVSKPAKERAINRWLSRGTTSQHEDKSVPRSNVVRPPDIMIPIIQLNPHITCPLCTGYLVQPCTITECNHTYCKSCIVKHVGFSLQCPVCDVNIHPTDPLSNIRRDFQKEEIILKLIPHLEQDERRQEKAFYKERGIKFTRKGGKRTPKKKQRLPTEHMVSLVLEYAGSSKPGFHKPLCKKYIHVSAKVSISQIQTFIRKKMNLDSDCQIGVFVDTALIHEKATLQYLLDNIPDLEEDGLIVLHYGILDSSVKSLFDSL